MTGLLSFAVIVLLFVVVVLIARTSELTAHLRGEYKDTSNISKVNGIMMLAFLVLFFVGIAYSLKLFLPIMIPKAASVHGEKTDGLFNLTMIFLAIVFVLTQTALFYFAYRYNESKTKEAYFYAHNNKLELVWTVIPAIVMAVLVTFGLVEWYKIFDVNGRDTKNMMVIEATAKQFNWIIRYPGKDGKLGERHYDKKLISLENELGIDWVNDKTSHDDFMPDKIYLVKNKPVLMKLGALDVLHAFFLPHFRVKMDCVPGLPTQFYFVPTMTTVEMQQYLSTQPWWQTTNPETGEPRWKTFKYELACAELCGASHYGMQKEVVVVTQAEYDEWAAKQGSFYESVVKPKLAQQNGEAAQPAAEPAAADSVKVSGGATAEVKAK